MATSKFPFSLPGAGNDKARLATAMQYLQSGMLSQAQALCRQVLAANPRQIDAHNMLAAIGARAGRFDEALRHLDESVRLNPSDARAHSNRGVALRKTGRDAEAVDAFRQAVRLQAGYAEAHFNLGNALRDTGQAAAALESYQRAVTLRPEVPEMRVNLIELLLRQGLFAPALDAARELARQQADARAFNLLGNALAGLKQHAAALDSYARAIAAAPQDARAFANRAAVLLELQRPGEAATDLDTALGLDPAQAATWEMRAEAALRLRQPGHAADCYQRVCAIDPEYPYAPGNALHARMLACDWRDFDAQAAAVQAALQAGRPAAEPFGYQAVATQEDDLLRCARLFASAEFPPQPAADIDALAAPDSETGPAAVGGDAVQGAAADGRITVGYLCGEFREHATTMLMCGVYEHHDRERFRVLAFDNGGDDHSAYRQRLHQAFESLIDIRGLSDAQAAQAIRRAGVDILVNLNGYFGEGRNGVFARRPAPIQVNYLGFPGTLGAPWMDYLLADPIVIPADSRVHYTEQVVHLPRCYQPGDNRRERPPLDTDRRAHGLPDVGLVFCCFNNCYKFTPAVFASWVRILERVPGSVLWLLEDNATARARLEAAAATRGLDPGRLVFAPRRSPSEHLARHGCADLFLDTSPYNAHTTASDALWMGLPVLTRQTDTFPGRVAASLLAAAGLPELVVHTEADYEDLAVRLATEPGALASLRERLTVQRAHCALFDTARTTRAIESAYETMVARLRAGEAPGYFAVADDAGASVAPAAAQPA